MSSPMDVDDVGIARLYNRNMPYSQLRSVQAALIDAIRENDVEVIEIIARAITPIVDMLRIYR